MVSCSKVAVYWVPLHCSLMCAADAAFFNWPRTIEQLELVSDREIT
jgi:hypothetical protein